jgi:hypothetical protein
MVTEFTEYHNILATMIQRKWNSYIIKKKILYMINPDHPFSLELKKNESEALNRYFTRIHAEETHFRSIVVEYNSGIVIKTVEINYYSKDNYSIYDNFIYTKLDTDQIKSELNKIQNIISIKIQAFVCDLNFYGYPELVQIKCY